MSHGPGPFPAVEGTATCGRCWVLWGSAPSNDLRHDRGGSSLILTGICTAALQRDAIDARKAKHDSAFSGHFWLEDRDSVPLDSVRSW